LGIPIGPVNLEVFHNAVMKHYAQAISVAVGAAFGDAVWAMLAFYGISPFASHPHMEAAFFLFTAIITCGLGIAALRNSHFIEKKEEHLMTKIKSKRWSLVKGFAMVIINPLGIVSWLICLQFLRKNGIFIPFESKYKGIFFFVVAAGVLFYFLLIVFITNRMKKIFDSKRTIKITKSLGYILIAFSLYFLVYALKAFFFNHHVIK